MSTSTSDKPSSQLYDIPKLLNDGSNYTLWKFCISQVLEAWGLSEYVSGAKPKPGISDTKGLEEWTVKDHDTRLQVTLTLEDDPLLSVLNLTESKAIWDALSLHYNGKGLQSVAYLTAKVFWSQMSDSQDLQMQINELCTYASKLNSLGHPLDDKMFVVAIILSLPPSYSTLQTVILAASGNKLDSQEVISTILAEEQRWCETSDKALKACTGKTGKLNKPKGDRPMCSNCKKLGCTKEKCWAPGGGAEKEKGKTTEKAKDEKAKVASTWDDSNTLEIFIADIEEELGALMTVKSNSCSASVY
jgi:gag-polypeptide of LTR copia-type